MMSVSKANITSQKPPIPSSQRVIEPTSVERKPLNHRPRVYLSLRSEVKSTKVTKQNKNYSPPQMPPIYHPCIQKKNPERHFLYLPQTVTEQPKVSYSQNTEIDLPKGQFDKHIKPFLPIKKKLLNKNKLNQQKNITETVWNYSSN